MWNAESSSSDNPGQLSEYERKRLENISQMSVEFSDLFDNVSTSAQNLQNSAPKTKIFANGKKRNYQQYRNIKMMSKRQDTPQSQTIRRSKRIINEKRKRPEYGELSDSDDEKPSKTLRVKFPFFMKSEFAKRDEDYYRQLNDADFIDSDDEFMEINDSYNRSRRGHKVSSNPHQVPVSLITQEMIKNITYSSCGKKYDAINGTTCHQCRQKTVDQKSYCRYKNCRGIRGMFCGFCLGKRYGEDVAEVLLNKKWACPPCRGYCNCSICRRKQGITPTGQLSQIAEAGGYKSVKHFLENTEGGIPEINLSSESDSDEDVKKDDQDNVSSEKEPTSEQSDILDITDRVPDNSIERCKQGITPTDQLSEITQAGENKSVKLLFKTTEGGIPEINLSSESDSDNDVEKGDQEYVKSEKEPTSEQSDILGTTECVPDNSSCKKHETVEVKVTEENLSSGYDSDGYDVKSEQGKDIYENIDNNLNDSKKEPMTACLNDKVTETDQNHCLVESKNQCSVNNGVMNSEQILDKIYQDLFFCETNV